jgi:hypothetical protein
MIKVTCQVETYDEPRKPSIKVHAHWNENKKVVIEIGDEKVTVLVDDIIAAVQNCSNTGRFS